MEILLLSEETLGLGAYYDWRSESQSRKKLRGHGDTATSSLRGGAAVGEGQPHVVESALPPTSSRGAAARPASGTGPGMFVEGGASGHGGATAASTDRKELGMDGENEQRQGRGVVTDDETDRESVKENKEGTETGRWRPEEHVAFLEAVRVHGKNWILVADAIKTRNATQVRTHAQKHFAKRKPASMSS